jgi:hypothetical protein
MAFIIVPQHLCSNCMRRRSRMHLDPYILNMPTYMYHIGSHITQSEKAYLGASCCSLNTYMCVCVCVCVWACVFVFVCVCECTTLNDLGLLWLYAQVHGAPLLYAQVRFASVS